MKHPNPKHLKSFTKMLAISFGVFISLCGMCEKDIDSNFERITNLPATEITLTSALVTGEASEDYMQNRLRELRYALATADGEVIYSGGPDNDGIYKIPKDQLTINGTKVTYTMSNLIPNTKYIWAYNGEPKENYFTTAKEASAEFTVEALTANVAKNDVTFSSKAVVTGGTFTFTEFTFSYQKEGGDAVTVAQDQVEGSATAGFNVEIEDLAMGTYTVKAIAKTAEATKETETKSFTIEVGAPSVTTVKAEYNDDESLLELAGKVTNTNGGDITDYRFKITEPSGNVTTITKDQISGTPTEEFVFSDEDFTVVGTYKIKAVATNEFGTTEGNELTYVKAEAPELTITAPQASADGEVINVLVDGTMVTLTFNSNVAWKVIDNDDIVSFDKTSGNAGDGQTVEITIPDNLDGGDARSINVIFTNESGNMNLNSVEFLQDGEF